MKLRWYKEVAVGLMLASVAIRWATLAAPVVIIKPFFLAPSVEIEFYNYISGIIREIAPLFLLAVILLNQWFTAKVNFDRAVNRWVKTVTQTVSIFAISLMVYHTKELIDYILFYNVIPDNVDYFRFLFGWEFLPFAAILLFAAWKSKIP